MFEPDINAAEFPTIPRPEAIDKVRTWRGSRSSFGAGRCTHLSGYAMRRIAL